MDHDFILGSLARDTVERARADAARRRLAIEARREATMRDDKDRGEYGIRWIAAGERITGVVALVIQPDAGTIEASYDLAATLMPAGADQVIGPGTLPHVTLTQCALRDAPRERVREFIARLDAELRGRSLPLSAVVAFGAGFLFWCADPTAPERRALQSAHEYAVTLAEGLLDPVANAAVVEATARLFADDPLLADNARQYGYALIRERYLPHITLGFDPRLGGDRREASGVAIRPHTLTVDRIVLAQVGAYGRVEGVFSV